ncbi:hypothetical protein ACFU6K_09270 [Kitasatospora sp. NPDC057512]|uniref:hypothetical protein n=1 Tax=Kitasatospora sp. NPDC057512 TaxID=3346154 RepID=UPI0036A8D89B
MNDPTTPTPTVAATVHHVQPDGKAGPALAHGFLLNRRTVLVPDPPQTVCDPWQRLAVRITVDPGPGPGPDDGAEALRVAGISLVALADDGIHAASAYLALLAPSHHATTPADVTANRLVEVLRQHHGDQWAAYAALGYPIRPPKEHAALTEPWWSDVPALDLREFVEAKCCLGSNHSCCRELRL